MFGFLIKFIYLENDKQKFIESMVEKNILEKIFFISKDRQLKGVFTEIAIIFGRQYPER